MSDMRSMVVATTERLLQNLCPPAVVNEAEKGTWPDRVWLAMEDAGLQRAWLPANAGGAGVDLGDVLAMLRAAGRYSAPVPFAETLLAGWMLHACGLRVPEGPMTIAPVAVEDRIDLQRTAQGWRLSGTARRVPWAADAGHLVIVGKADGKDIVAAVQPSRCQVSPGRNVAGEPRDAVDFTGVIIDAAQMAEAPPQISQSSLWQRGALMRCALMAGAVEKAMELSLRYAMERVQFGKPIGKFQAVQQQLALMCAEVAAACVVTDAAAQAIDQAIDGSGGLAETACAKTRVGEAAGTVAALAHQIHGAIGITYEHSLHHSTRRLWSWRDEFGSEAEWAERLGQWIARRGSEGYWPGLTALTGIPVSA